MNLAIASVGVERPSPTRKRGPHPRLCAASYSPPCTGGLPGELERLALAEPPMIGAEYLTAAVPEASWRGSRPPRPRVTGAVGARTPSGLGQDALLDFRMELMLDGEALTSAEIRDLPLRRMGSR